MPVEIALQLPDDVADVLRLQGTDISRIGLEKLVCSLYRDGLLSQVQAMKDLNVSGRLAFEALLARHNLFRDWPDGEIGAELAALDKLRGLV